MKIAYKHLVNFIPSKPTINDISQKLFQLGHEHEILDDIFDMELTPNRGDCLSINGILRDLAAFYEVSNSTQLYENELQPLSIDFINKAQDACPHISFLKIEIEGDIKPYQGVLKDYFDNPEIKKNNFFTDISNYISYETGQPTHCYDAKKIKESFSLEISEQNHEFETLIGKTIKLKGKNLVFLQDNNSVINLAGVMGGSNTSCSEKTTSTIIECAYFNPECIIGKTIKYDIKSDAAHKFERGVDPLCHEKVLRRFIKIVEDHAVIKNVAIFKKDYIKFKEIQIAHNPDKIKKILGISIGPEEIINHLSRLGFISENNKIIPPSYRRDIFTENDIAEEIARIIGYDNIPVQPFKTPLKTNNDEGFKLLEENIKNFLIDNGFFEVINNPFIGNNSKHSIKVDNPLDSNKQYIRTNLEKSLIENLLYNEKRQQDSIKLFEISELYYLQDEKIQNTKMLGIICSGRVGKNYNDFSKPINNKYLKTILKKAFPEIDFHPSTISRENLESKLTNEIVYIEIELDDLKNNNFYLPNQRKEKLNKNNFIKYIPISQFPCSVRDLSFAVNDKNKYYELQDFLLNYKEDLIKEIYVFDFYNNEKKDEIKIGFRFIFQSKTSTITENQVNDVMNKIINETLSIGSVKIPGLEI